GEPPFRFEPARLPPTRYPFASGVFFRFWPLRSGPDPAGGSGTSGAARNTVITWTPKSYRAPRTSPGEVSRGPVSFAIAETPLSASESSTWLLSSAGSISAHETNGRRSVLGRGRGDVEPEIVVSGPECRSARGIQDADDRR